MKTLPQLTDADLQRFWKRVSKSDGCWICNANPAEKYARMRFNGVSYLAHVLSYLMVHRVIGDGDEICHKCNTPRCVRPDHLEAKSHSHNMRYMVEAGRNNPARGQQQHCSKFTDEEIPSVREAICSGKISINDVAKQRGTSFQCVYQMAVGNTWNHVGGPLLSKREVRDLSKEEVWDIRIRCKNGEKQSEVAASYQIWPAVVSNIVRGVKRKDVPMP